MHNESNSCACQANWPVSTSKNAGIFRTFTFPNKIYDTASAQIKMMPNTKPCFIEEQFNELKDTEGIGNYGQPFRIEPSAFSDACICFLSCTTINTK